MSFLSSVLSALGLSWLVLAGSTAMSYLILYSQGKPFFRKTSFAGLKKTLQVGLLNTLVYSPILVSTGLWRRLWTPPLFRTWDKDFRLLLFYTYSVEFLYYGLHRMMHSSVWLYKWVHATHHENVKVAPADTFYTGFLDLFLTIQTIHLPAYWLEGVRWWHFAWMHAFYIVGSFWVHRKGTDHAWHHQFRQGNFAFLFPLFDVILGTRQIWKKEE